MSQGKFIWVGRNLYLKLTRQFFSENVNKTHAAGNGIYVSVVWCREWFETCLRNIENQTSWIKIQENLLSDLWLFEWGGLKLSVQCGRSSSILLIPQACNFFFQEILIYILLLKKQYLSCCLFASVFMIHYRLKWTVLRIGDNYKIWKLCYNSDLNWLLYRHCLCISNCRVSNRQNG